MMWGDVSAAALTLKLLVKPSAYLPSLSRLTSLQLQVVPTLSVHEVVKS